MADKNDEPPPSRRVSPADVLRGIRDEEDDLSSTSVFERRYIERFQQVSVQSQVSYAHLQGIRDHYRHKGRWSWLLMFAIIGMLGFQSYILLEVGRGNLDFTKYDWLLPALLVQNLGQVIGLAVYAVKYLFSDISGQKLE